MKTFLFALLALSFSIQIQAQQVESYSLYIDFFPANAQMWGHPVSNNVFLRGNSEVVFSEISAEELIFYLHGELKIDSILADGMKITYDCEKIFYRKNYSRVALKTTFQASELDSGKAINIFYSGFMNPSRARSLSDYMHINKETGVFLRSHGYSLWFPVFINSTQETYKADFKRVRITLPEKFQCVVTGEQLDEKVKKGRSRSVWNPGMIDISKLQCTAREYKSLSEDQVYVYYLNGRKNGEKIIDYVSRLKELFQKNLRSVQNSSSLYILEMPKYGNISSSNVVGISSNLFNDFEKNLNSKFTIAHELVHPYVTIPVSQKNPFAALVKEGFPSFFQVYALEKTVEDSLYDIEKHMKRVENRYLKRKRSGKNHRGYDLPPEKPILKITYDEIGNYKDQFILSDRVWLFLYHLWCNMGDEDYDRFLKELFTLDSIDYNYFERLVLSYLPDYKGELNIWLNTNKYPEFIHVAEK